MSLIATFDVDGGLRHSIYLGGKADAKNYEKLVNRWKIKHVLNCTPPKQTNIEAGVPNYFEKSNTQQQHQRLVYHRIPIYDSPTSLPELKAKHESEIIQFITKGLCHGNVFVHCSRGVSRSTTSVVLYLMAKRQFRYESALTMIRRRRPEAQPIPAFDEWLQERDCYYRALHKTDHEKNNDGDGDGDDGSSEIETTTITSTTIHPNKKRKKNVPSGAVIGPALPPPPSNQAIESSAVFGPSSISIGSSPPPPSIGPELPPVTTPKSNSNNGTIGPALPPGLAATDNKSIGPEFPP